MGGRLLADMGHPSMRSHGFSMRFLMVTMRKSHCEIIRTFIRGRTPSSQPSPPPSPFEVSWSLHENFLGDHEKSHGETTFSVYLNRWHDMYATPAS